MPDRCCRGWRAQTGGIAIEGLDDRRPWPVQLRESDGLSPGVEPGPAGIEVVLAHVVAQEEADDDEVGIEGLDELTQVQVFQERTVAENTRIENLDGLLSRDARQARLGCGNGSSYGRGAHLLGAACQP